MRLAPGNQDDRPCASSLFCGLRLLATFLLTFLAIILYFSNRNDGGRGELSKERLAKLDACALADAMQGYLREVRELPHYLRNGFSGEIDRELIGALSGASGEMARRRIKLIDVPAYWKDRVVTPWGHPYKLTVDWSAEAHGTMRGNVTIDAGRGITCGKQISRPL
jgi:hypothetical protein